jgi:hypothetical protein
VTARASPTIRSKTAATTGNDPALDCLLLRGAGQRISWRATLRPEGDSRAENGRSQKQVEEILGTGRKVTRKQHTSPLTDLRE